MSRFRSAFFYWWMLLLALYALKQPASINSNTVGCTSTETAALTSGADMFISGEYLTPFYSTTTSYDIKTSIPDIDVPYWQQSPEPAEAKGLPIVRPDVVYKILSIHTILFPFHDFW